LSQNTPTNLFTRTFGKSVGQSLNTNEWRSIFCTKKQQCHALDLVLQNMLDNYAIVGVLERMDEVMEVLRCRFSWFQTQTTHHKSRTEKCLKQVPLNRIDDLINGITSMKDVIFFTWRIES